MDFLALLGLSLNLIGSIILAFSLNKTIEMLGTSISALEIFKDTYLNRGDIVSVEGMDKHRKRVFNKAKGMTNFGLTFLILGFVLQILGITLNQLCLCH